MDSIAGKIIHVEGADGCGKTTQAKRTIKWLSESGYNCKFIRQPGYTEVGEKIRELLFGGTDVDDVTKRYLFAANHSSLVKEVYSKADKETVYICDRYVPASNLVIGSYGDGIDINYIKNLNKLNTLGHYPNLIIVYRVSEETMVSRLQQRSICKGEINSYDLKDRDFKARVRNGYDNIEKHLCLEERKLLRYIDADEDEDSVFQKTMAIIKQSFNV